MYDRKVTNIMLMYVSGSCGCYCRAYWFYCNLGVVPTSWSRKSEPLVSSAKVSSFSFSSVGVTGGDARKHEHVVRWDIPEVDESKPANMTPWDVRM